MSSQSESVRIVVGDSNRQFCASVKSALSERGFRNVVPCHGADRLAHLLDETIVDVLLYDHTLSGPEFTETMQAIRSRKLGRNPFVVVLATLHDASLDSLKMLVDSGIDDTLQKPVPPDRLFARIESYINRRKPFAVSSDYVGPTRREAARPGDETALIEVPNTLRGKLVDGLNANGMQAHIASASETLAKKRGWAVGEELMRLVERVQGFHHGMGGETELVRDLNRIVELGRNLRRQYHGTPAEYIAEMGNLLAELTKRLLVEPTKALAVELALLPRLTDAVRGALVAEVESRFVAQEIVSAVSLFTKTH